MVYDHYIQALKTMGSSGDPLIDNVFRLCVIFLVDLADTMGLTYEQINVWIFVVIWPLITVSLLVYVLFLRQKMRQLLNMQKKTIGDGKT